MNIYEIGSNGYWTGQTKSLVDIKGIPRGWTRSPVPVLSAGTAAFWTGEWNIVGIPSQSSDYLDTTPTSGIVSAPSFMLWTSSNW